jgi:polar amino acid transport system ATP-binding protein
LVGEVLDVILELTREGRTMLLVTHELGFAYHFATRVLFLHDGRVLEQGTPEEVLRNPREERTRAFIGRHSSFAF